MLIIAQIDNLQQYRTFTNKILTIHKIMCVKIFNFKCDNLHLIYTNIVNLVKKTIAS